MQKRYYDHIAIEKKWQKYWEEHESFKACVDHSKPKYYILDMFPYPSGAGLHVGHVTGYTATDIIARYKRQKGFNVLHPMGWDSFGLPAEQYAIRTGTHPRITTEKSIQTYKKQLQSLGFSYDWDKEIATSDPKYYKWTQWIFTKLYEKGLAYEAEMLVNYCPALGTVVANEEVENGFTKEGGYQVERRPLKQWVLKITEYADRLLDDLEELDWPEYLKRLQRNWIGKSQGASIIFKEEKTGESLEVFTTRPDTLMGVSYLVISPEHPLLKLIVSGSQEGALDAYLRKVATKSDLERTELSKDKSGVFTGAYAAHPVTGKPLEIWAADYVLMSYGTGIVMGVPSGDERDFAFATTYDLPIKPVYEPDVKQADSSLLSEHTEEGIKKLVLQGKLCWDKEGICINSHHEDFNLNGLNIEQAKLKAIDWLVKHAKGKKTTTYKLRDWLFSRQRYWAEPFPILHFEDGSKRVLDLDELPLIPPDLEDFKPAGDGRSPLAKLDHWVNIRDPKTGQLAKRETNTMPQWAGSCWYYLRFCDPHNTKHAWGQEEEAYWMPVDLYVGGVEHAVLHLLYSRFWHKVLFDAGFVSTKEPFKTLRNQGLVTARAYKLAKGGYVAEHDVERKEDGSIIDKKSHLEVKSLIEKMSKSKLNGVNPDEIIEEYGADTLRLYEMFMGPFDKEKLWNHDAILGCRRLLNRLFDLVISEKVVEHDTEEALRLGHKLIFGIERDIEQMFFNTAIAKLMEFVNAFVILDVYPKSVLKMAIKALYPFAPHFAEECHEILGGEGSLTHAAFPTYDEKYLTESFVTYVVQVNGKLRARLLLPKDTDKEKLMLQAKEFDNVKKHLDGQQILSEVFVPNKLINFVIKT